MESFEPIDSVEREITNERQRRDIYGFSEHILIVILSPGNIIKTGISIPVFHHVHGNKLGQKK